MYESTTAVVRAVMALSHSVQVHSISFIRDTTKQRLYLSLKVNQIMTSIVTYLSLKFQQLLVNPSKLVVKYGSCPAWVLFVHLCRRETSFRVFSSGDPSIQPWLWHFYLFQLLVCPMPIAIGGRRTNCNFANRILSSVSRTLPTPKRFDAIAHNLSDG